MVKDHLRDYDLRGFQAFFSARKKSSKPGSLRILSIGISGCLIHRDPGIKVYVL